MTKRTENHVLETRGKRGGHKLVPTLCGGARVTHFRFHLKEQVENEQEGGGTLFDAGRSQRPLV